MIDYARYDVRSVRTGSFSTPCAETPSQAVVYAVRNIRATRDERVWPAPGELFEVVRSARSGKDSPTLVAYLPE